MDAGWLRDHLTDPRVRVVEVDVSPANYRDWHIDGAVLWNVYADLKDGDYRTVDAAAVQRLDDPLGHRAGLHGGVYGYTPALALWLMKLYGHRDVRILNCSRDAWRGAGYPWSTVETEPPPGSYRFDGEDAGIRADWTAVREAIGRRERRWSTCARRPSTRGSASGRRAAWSQAGARVTCPRPFTSPSTASTARTGRSAPPRSCATLFAPDVLDGDDQPITYCTIGGRAANAWFVLTRLLGRQRVRVYDGSWAKPIQSYCL